jgi:hypothetical protein
MSAEAPAFNVSGSESTAVGVAIFVLVLQWFLISFSAVRAFDTAIFSVLGAMVNQIRRWIARSRRAAERMTSRKGRVPEFDEFLHACAATEQKIDQLNRELSALRSEALAAFAETLHAIVFEFERLEIAFVDASRSACLIVERPGEALCETQKIRARIEATWRDYTDLCSQRQKAARRILMGRARDVRC